MLHEICMAVTSAGMTECMCGGVAVQEGVSISYCSYINDHAYYLLCLFPPPTGTHAASQPRQTWQHLFRRGL